MLQASHYFLVLILQLSLLTFDLFVNSFCELLRRTPAIQLLLFIMQDTGVLLNMFVFLLMLFNTYVFHVGLGSVLLERFRGLLFIALLYLFLSVTLHSWVMNLRWLNSNRFVWTEGLRVLFILHRLTAVLYYYLYKCTAECLGDPRLYQDSPWLRQAFAQSWQ